MSNTENARKWYENAFIYQIYPRSFADSNNDGVGDIPGIISKLDYLKELGVDGIWISPFYQSPLDDCGYDIADFESVAPEYGTMDDFDRLVSEAHARGIRVLLDLVVNHTSTRHRWFKAAIADPTSKYHDYYFWRTKDELTGAGDTRGEGSGYGEDIWEYVPETGLNWDNPAVRDEICSMVNFWLDRGVDGFRCDVIYLISKEPTLTHFGMGPHLHEYLHELYTRCFEPHGAITVAEVWGQTPETTLTMTGYDRGELTMSFYFDHMGLGREGRFIKTSFKPEDFVSELAKWQYGINGRGANALVLENHDQSRIVSRFGDPVNYRAESATMLAALTFLMNGTAYIYQGEELGLVNAQFDSLDDIRDVETLDYIDDMHRQGDMTEDELLRHVNFGTRDVGRVPMPWTGGEYFGFSSVKPWLWGNCPYEATNAEAERNDPNSVFSFFKKMIALKKSDPALSYGEFKLIDNDAGYFRYIRELDGRTVTVLGNFSPEARKVALSGLDGASVLLSNYGVASVSGAELELRPYEAMVLDGIN